MDFMRGASLSEGGKPVILPPSTTKRRRPKIMPFLKQGTGAVTTWAHLHYIVIEYGIANLYGRNLHQRAIALAKIAHPNHCKNLFANALAKMMIAGIR